MRISPPKVTKFTKSTINYNNSTTLSKNYSKKFTDTDTSAKYLKGQLLSTNIKQNNFNFYKGIVTNYAEYRYYTYKLQNYSFNNKTFYSLGSNNLGASNRINKSLIDDIYLFKNLTSRSFEYELCISVSDTYFTDNDIVENKLLELSNEYVSKYNAKLISSFSELKIICLRFDKNIIDDAKDELSNDTRIDSFSTNNYFKADAFVLPSAPDGCIYNCLQYPNNPFITPPNGPDDCTNRTHTLTVNRFLDNRLALTEPLSCFQCRPENEPHALQPGDDWPRLMSSFSPDPSGCNSDPLHNQMTVWHLDRIDQKSLPLDRLYKSRTEPLADSDPDPVHVYVVDASISTFETNSPEYGTRLSVGYRDENSSLKDHNLSVSSLICGESVGVSRQCKVISVGTRVIWGTIPTVDILESLNWILKQRLLYPKRRMITNMSLGSQIHPTEIAANGGSYYNDAHMVPLNAVEKSILKCLDNNIHIVLAAGNGSTMPRYYQDVTARNNNNFFLNRPCDASEFTPARLGGSENLLEKDTGVVTVGATTILSQCSSKRYFRNPCNNHPAVYYDVRFRPFVFYSNIPASIPFEERRFWFAYPNPRPDLCDNVDVSNDIFPPNAVFRRHGYNYVSPEVSPGFFADCICDFSNYGKAVDIYAPGEYIKAFGGKGIEYKTIKGTSFSAPMVAGVLAEILRYFDTDPDNLVSPIQAKGMLLGHATANPLGKWFWTIDALGILGLSNEDNNKLLYNPFTDCIDNLNDDSIEPDTPRVNLNVIQQPQLINNLVKTDCVIEYKNTNNDIIETIPIPNIGVSWWGSVCYNYSGDSLQINENFSTFQVLLYEGSKSLPLEYIPDGIEAVAAFFSHPLLNTDSVDDSLDLWKRNNNSLISSPYFVSGCGDVTPTTLPPTTLPPTTLPPTTLPPTTLPPTTTPPPTGDYGILNHKNYYFDSQNQIWLEKQ